MFHVQFSIVLLYAINHLFIIIVVVVLFLFYVKNLCGS